MSQPNYESKWWGYIYDEMMTELQYLVDDHYRFYTSSLRDVKGPVLECACGTGIFLLPLLAADHDMYGFDISDSMLATLKRKAAKQGVDDIEKRISIQEFESFRYEQQFGAILIPTNTFSMLTSQEAQIKTLQNIYAHLAPDGQFLLDFRLAGMRNIVEEPAVVEGRWHTFTHPETGLPIRQRIVGRRDFNNQLILDQCFIEYEGETDEFPMTARWIFKDEFQLLLRLAGFTHWECFNTPERDPLELGVEETYSYWSVRK